MKHKLQVVIASAALVAAVPAPQMVRAAKAFTAIELSRYTAGKRALPRNKLSASGAVIAL